MKKKQTIRGCQEHLPEESQSQPRLLRLPGFIIEEQVGLGDAIKRATYALGITPCGGCERRAAALNSWIRFTR